MWARLFSWVAGTAFAIIAVWQLAGAIGGWPLVIGSLDMPVGASWVAFLAALMLAVVAYLAALRD